MVVQCKLESQFDWGFASRIHSDKALLNQKSNEKHILCWRKFARMDACLENTHKRKACILYRILTNERSARLKSLNPEECMWFSCPLD
nr:hypothetical protein CFP56_72185 [Quercus suber]